MSKLKSFSAIKHVFSTKEEGNMSYLWGDEKTTYNNRKDFLSSAGIDINASVALHIQNQDILFFVDKNYKGRGMSSINDALLTDGLITREKGVYLFLVIADCLSMIIFDKKQKILGLIHAGWQSTDKKIAYKAAIKFIEEFNSKPFDLNVFLGPAIHKESFRFKNPIQKKLSGWENFLEDFTDGETGIDLIGYNLHQFLRAGVQKENIFISDIDTAKDKRFFSHYHDSKENKKQEGRFACVVGIK